jgi:general secretion pathway protein K
MKLTFRNSRGVALIMVLWVITILTVVVLEFSFAMRTEVNITKNFKDELQLYAIAQGGVQRAVAEMILKHDTRLQQLKKTMKAEDIAPEKEAWVPDGRPYTVQFDQGECELRIMSEAGTININTVSEMTLGKIIRNLGLEGETGDMVVDSILDWIDADDFRRINGAENDYYQSLKEPYHCKNSNLDSIEELLLVRGVTPELFYGRRGTKAGEEGGKTYDVGLKDIFSIYAPGEQIDINSASSVVLKFALGIPDKVARLIVKAREEKAFESLMDLRQRVPELASLPSAGDFEKLIVTQSMTPYYAIESRARNKAEGSVRGLKAIVKIDRMDQKGYKIIQWVDTLL